VGRQKWQLSKRVVEDKVRKEGQGNTVLDEASSSSPVGAVNKGGTHVSFHQKSQLSKAIYLYIWNAIVFCTPLNSKNKLWIFIYHFER
jgi:hypothetical protein